MGIGVGHFKCSVDMPMRDPQAVATAWTKQYRNAQAENDHTPCLVFPIDRAPPPAASRSPFLRRKIVIFPPAARIWFSACC